MKKAGEPFTGAAVKRIPGSVGRARSLRRQMTLPEKLLWVELRKLGLNFRRQCPIGRYIADFACQSARLIVEVDSARTICRRKLHDAQRTAWLQTQGYRVIRFRNGEVAGDLKRVVGDIAAAVLQDKARSLPLDGGGAGVRVDAPPFEREALEAPPRLRQDAAPHSPPSPALPPSRGKGERV